MPRLPASATIHEADESGCAGGRPTIHETAVSLGWTAIPVLWPTEKLNAVECLLPHAYVAAVARYHRWQDRQARLAARLILREILRRHRPDKSLDDVCIDPRGRPFIIGGGNFSISHTDRLAVCAWTAYGRVGIDVETARTGLALDDMLPWMSEAERIQIGGSADQAAVALASWTAKEAVCKAQGCGLIGTTLPDCAGSRVVFGDTTWHVRTRSRRAFAISIAHSEPLMHLPHVFRLRI